jgi:hypothetical protein
MREAYGETVDADEHEWRPLTGDPLRDLDMVTQSRMRDLAKYLWESNLLANWLIETPLDFILAEGVRLTSKDDQAQEWLDAFWDDPINQMDLKLEKKLRELAMYGEQCYPVFVNEINGHVRLGYLNPALIATVVMDPDNPEQPVGIVTRKDKKGNARRYRVIINGDEDVFTSRTQEIRQTFDDGECFFFKVNDLCEGRNGRSDILAAMDWIDTYEQFMFGEVDRSNFLRAFIWDITLTGADAEEVKRRAREIAAPKPGSARVHNDAEKWSAETPSLQAADSSEAARLFRNHIMGGQAMPEHWFGGGGDVNRATAAEMDEPTLKRLKRRQKFAGYMLQMIGDYQVMSRAAAENVKYTPEMKAIAQMPEMTSADVAKYTTALQQAATGCAVLLDKGLISEEMALTIISRIAAEMNVEIDPAAELKVASAEAAKRREADVFTEPPVVSEGAQA